MEQVSGMGYKGRTVMLAWIAVLLSGSCTQAEVDEKEIHGESADVETKFQLSVLASRLPMTRSLTFTPEGTLEEDLPSAGEKDSLSTRAADPLGDDQESKIAGVWIGQYDGNGLRLFSQYLTSLDESSTASVMLKRSTTGEQSHIWFVANVDDLGNIEKEDALKSHLLGYTTTDKLGLPANNLCGMVGQWSGVVKEDGAKISVSLTRLLAKISFTYKTEGESFTFTPTAVKLKSVPTGSQVAAPEKQLEGMEYTEYEGIANKEGATMYWYLPENMAGTPAGEDAVQSEKKKTGRGVKEATYIELTGTAVQDGITYNGVSFRFYPGTTTQDYNIERNSHYKMTVTLKGIDISDERITVTDEPSVDIDEGNMPAEKGGTKEVRITARPGQPWNFMLDSWLSVLISGKTTAQPGNMVHYQGPATVVFTSVEANPKAEERKAEIVVDVNGEHKVTITQDGSTLTKGQDISLEVVSGSEGSSTFQVTEGLQWQVVVSGEEWWKWKDKDNVSTLTGESDGKDVALNVQSRSLNPHANARTATITVAAGASIAGGYDGLKKQITVSQKGSTVSSSTVTVEPEVAESQSATFTATPGLAWKASVTNGSWLSLTGTTAGDQTTGNAQKITFKTGSNQTASQRSGTITVHAGDEKDGPTGVITVVQKASNFTAKSPTEKIPKGGGSVTGSVTAASGLKWTISPKTSNEITVSPTSGTGGMDLKFTASANTQSSRTGTFTITLTDSPSRTVTVKATQKAGLTVPVVGSIRISNQDAGNMSQSEGSTVCSQSNESNSSGWRLPTAPELQAIKSAEEDLNDVPGYTPMVQVTYWSSDPYGSTSGKAVDMKTGAQVFAPKSTTSRVRCVRYN
ncbi:BACON domain-containing carbohydrate-binding protein [Parabacteroides sp.]|uniref:BACON domain-containing protein n=1 Tax=Parabacteroides sp. TaxID=1869337 RepID=UPI00308083DF